MKNKKKSQEREKMPFIHIEDEILNTDNIARISINGSHSQYEIIVWLNSCPENMVLFTNLSSYESAMEKLKAIYGHIAEATKA